VRRSSLSRRTAAVFWSCAAFFALGYFPTAMSHSPVISTAAAACVVIPFGSRARSVVRGVLRGFALGLMTGIASLGALTMRTGQLAPAQTAGLAAATIGATTGLCAAVAGLFAYLARRRARLIDAQWDDLNEP